MTTSLKWRAGLTILGVIAVSCDHPVVAPTAPPTPLRPAGAPLFNLVQDAGTVAGPLLKEVFVQLPASGGITSDLVVPLWQAGEVGGPAIIEVSGNIYLDHGRLPVTDAMTSGVFLWYEPTVVLSPPVRPSSSAPLPGSSAPVPGQGVLIVIERTVPLSFEQTPPGDTAARLGVSVAQAADSVRLVDSVAPQHAMRLRWSYADGNSLGFPENIPNPACAYVWFACAPLPPQDSTHLSTGQAQGTARIRVYGVPGLAVRITPASGSMQVHPDITGGTHTLQLQVGVFSAAGTAVPNQTVGLTLVGINQSGGHTHGGTMPPGQVSTSTVSTGSTGIKTVVYTADVFGGLVQIQGTSPGAKTATDTITLSLPGLLELQQGAHIDRVGTTPAHPDSHWGTAGMLSALTHLADSLFAYNLRSGLSAVTLQVNDISLPLGGKFDLNADYLPGGEHQEHRRGTNADVETAGLTAKQIDFLRAKWQALSTLPPMTAVHDETKTRNHFHFRF